MALPGPAPKPNKVGHSPTAEWTEVPNLPFLSGREHDLPERVIFEEIEDKAKRLVEAGWTAQTRAWWDIVRTMPHASLWTDADWNFATDTAYLKESFYTGTASAAEMVEMRRREDLLGLSLEARRKLRIRYVPPADETVELMTASSHTPVGVISISDRRRRMQDT
jgi:hypothetical protein